MTRRVVVTGLGVISSLGADTEGFWQACLQGRSEVAPIPARWDEFAQYRSRIWAPLTLPDFSTRFSRVERSQHDPVTLMAAACAADAFTSAGLSMDEANRRANTFTVNGIDALRTGVFIGTGVGGAHSFMANHAYQVLARTREHTQSMLDEASDGPWCASLASLLARTRHGARFNPFAVSMLMPNAPAAYVGIKYGLRGVNDSCTKACASGTVAVGRAWRAIARGEVDHALAGGAEYLDDDHGSIFQGFDICRALVRDCEPAEAANRPFDADRSGFLFSQGGAAMLFLESAEHAQRRGVDPLAEVVGFNESFDAYSMMNPHPEGVAMEGMLRGLLADANLAPADVDYINAHGTSTQSNDACEAAVIQRVFGRTPAVNSTKSLLGHTIGASGAIEAAVTALSLRHQKLHPSRNIENPVADLDFVSGAAERPLRFAISQSFAFGGHNAAVLMAAPGEVSA